MPLMPISSSLRKADKNATFIQAFFVKLVQLGQFNKTTEAQRAQKAL